MSSNRIHRRQRRTGASAPGGAARSAAHRRGAGFTVVELLVVIGVILVLAVLTATGVQRVTKESRVATATNQVMASLGQARALAIRENRPMLVTFRARTDPLVPGNDQRTEIVIGRWTGQILKVVASANDPASEVWNLPFIEHPEAGRRVLPTGIKVAGPRTDFDQDGIWVTQPEYRNNEYGRSIGVLFAADGTVATRLPNGIGVAQYESAYLDADQDGQQDVGNSSGGSRFFEYNEEVDEPSVQYVRTLAVFDDADAREVYAPSNWAGSNQASGDASGSPPGPDCSQLPAGQSRMRCEQSSYINQFAERINFNRFTGVAEAQKR
ncbi:MAG: hypothetical protein U0574_06585 [Phycisphaerales bacterium]